MTIAKGDFHKSKNHVQVSLDQVLSRVPALKKWVEYLGAEVPLFCGSAQRVGIGQPRASDHRERRPG